MTEHVWSNREVVEALYLGILGRHGEAAGLDAHTQALSGRRDLRALTNAVKGFIDSEEFKVRLNEAQFNPILHAMRSTPKISKDPIHHVMSVGASCSTSAMLQRWWLRNFAGPFDWMFSSMAMIHHILSDDFRVFLDPSQMVPVADAAGIVSAAQHKFYMPYAQYPDGHEGAPLFLHHDAISKDRAHFERSVDRMRAALSASTLLVGFYRNQPDQIDGFLQLARYLMVAAPKARLMAFVVAPSPGRLLPDVMLTQSEGPHLLYEIKALGGLSEFGCENFLDELVALRMIHQYVFDLKPA